MRQAMSAEEPAAASPGAVQPKPNAEVSAGPAPHHPYLGLLRQLKQRNVFRVAGLYLAVCWLILEPVHVVFHMLEVPLWANRLVLLIMAIGFPAAVIFAWVYEITPGGLKPSAEVPQERSIRKVTGRRLDRAIIAVLAVALTYLLVDKFWWSHAASLRDSATNINRVALPRAAASVPPAFSPPPHSIAVLPFVNMSGDKDQEYFSEGLTEELLNSLSRINELQVAARTSSFSFQGEHPDIETVAHKLNVGAVLEGSVRRSGSTVRITAQLINGVSGFHVWSQTYDRDLGDILKLQTDLATAVAEALRVTLLSGAPARIELGGTRNPAALDAYLRGKTLINAAPSTSESDHAAIAALSEAIRQDPGYALAYADRSIAYINLAVFRGGKADIYASSLADAREAVRLAPELAEGYYALGAALSVGEADYVQADHAVSRSVELAPGNARILAAYSRWSGQFGRAAEALRSGRRAIELDPLNFHVYRVVGIGLLLARQYREAVADFERAIALEPKYLRNYALLGMAQYEMGNLEAARLSCEQPTNDSLAQRCLAITYHKLGRTAEATALLNKMKAADSDQGAYDYAAIYAQWGDIPRALDALETAVRLSKSGLDELKAEPDFDPLRREPRFQAILRSLKFPD
jgi:adenylate cyclase